MSNWALLANLAYGVTTVIDVQPSTVDILAHKDLIDAGRMIGPRLLSTGPGIFNDNRFESYEHARRVLSRYKDHYRVRNLKSYIAGNREQRQWIVQAAETLGLMPTTEGALDMKLDMTHIIDGFSGNRQFPHSRPAPGCRATVARLGHRLYADTARKPTVGPPARKLLFHPANAPEGDSEAQALHSPQLLVGATCGTLVRRPSMFSKGSPPSRQDLSRSAMSRRFARPTAGTRLPLGTVGARERRTDALRGPARRHLAWC